MPRERLELSHLAILASKTRVSTNSTIWAKRLLTFSLSLLSKKLVGREGFEPPKAKPVDLQSTPFDHSGICPKNSKRRKLDFQLLLFPNILMEPLIGFEPMTVRLQGECSTNWAKVASKKCETYIIKNTIKVKFFL